MVDIIEECILVWGYRILDMFRARLGIAVMYRMLHGPGDYRISYVFRARLGIAVMYRMLHRLGDSSAGAQNIVAGVAVKTRPATLMEVFRRTDLPGIGILGSASFVASRTE